MTYTKPSILALSAASVAIQGSGKKGNQNTDGDPANGPLTTAGSYDLDE